MVRVPPRRALSRWLLPATAPDELAILLTALAFVVGAWLLLELSDELVEGKTHDLDRWIVLSLRRSTDSPDPVGPHWLQVAARDVTSLGGRAVLTLATTAVAIYFSLMRRHREALLLVGGTLGGVVVMSVLKFLVARPRPIQVPGIVDDASSSFPSGHAMLSAIVYLSLGSILSSLVTARRLRNYIFAVALSLTFLVGLSRVYLGVHYPTDVLAGWTLGLLWGVACSLMTHRLSPHEAASART